MHCGEPACSWPAVELNHRGVWLSHPVFEPQSWEKFFNCEPSVSGALYWDLTALSLIRTKFSFLRKIDSNPALASPQSQHPLALTLSCGLSFPNTYSYTSHQVAVCAVFPGSPFLSFLALSDSTFVSKHRPFSSPQGQLCNAPSELGSQVLYSISDKCSGTQVRSQWLLTHFLLQPSLALLHLQS